MRTIHGHSKVISTTFEQIQSCVTAHDRVDCTRRPTGNDSDVIFPTIGDFSCDFSNVHWTVTSHSRSFGLTPKLYPNDFRASEDHFDPFGAHITHFEQNHSCVTARDRYPRTRNFGCCARTREHGSRGLKGVWQWAFARCSRTCSLVMCDRTRIWRTRPSSHCSSTRTFACCFRTRNFGCCVRSRS